MFEGADAGEDDMGDKGDIERVFVSRHREVRERFGGGEIGEGELVRELGRVRFEVWLGRGWIEEKSRLRQGYGAQGGREELEREEGAEFEGDDVEVSWEPPLPRLRRPGLGGFEPDPDSDEEGDE